MRREPVRESARKWLSTASMIGVVVGCLLAGVTTAQMDSTSSPSASAARKNSSGTKPTGTGTKVSTGKSVKAKVGGGTAQAKPGAGTRSKSSSSTVARSSKSKRLSAKKTAGKKTARGQQKIDPQRAQAIQQALIREHYLTGEPAGTWNQASEDALRKYQADHGWQSKTVPDSRALISLGLGPSHDGLLNPDSAMTTGPDVSHSASVSSSPQAPVSHGAQPGAPMNQNSPSSGESTPVSSDHDSPQ